MGLKDDYLTISEAASYIGVTRQTISRWLKKGKLEAEKVGRERVINKKDLVYVHRDERAWEIVNNKIVAGMANDIRKEYGYDKQDKIEMIFHDPSRGFFTYIVTRKDGTLDKIAYYQAIRRVEGGVLWGASKLARERYVKVDEDTKKPVWDEEADSSH